MSKGKGLEDFTRKHGPPDIGPRVLAGLKQLGESWEGTLEFMQRCGIGARHLAEMKERFAEYTVPVKDCAKRPTVVWAGTKAFAAKLRAVGTRGK